MIAIDVVFEDPRWEDAGLADIADRAIRATLTHLSISGDREVVVLGCNDTRISHLNTDFRSIPKPTNVLSWPSDERAAVAEGQRPEPPSEEPELGDIAIAFETTTREAEAAGISRDAHATHLIVHATLHLLGYDHIRDGDGDLMEATEIAILHDLGLPDPYSGGGVAPDLER